ncbi:hypothetical protein D9611_008664 [Ephemerocybe angulata]|uniref:Uncharacterized protein n=1 Tax=Ephemerocybe angulata TaxID=980116 RepID=A0A8H5AYJ2_9AGAR|nr:hypothetical protein D9611_008664 [Tulosesus angulatus]
MLPEATRMCYRRYNPRHMPLARSAGIHLRRYQQLSSPREFKVVMEGGALYIGKELAEALGWTPSTPTDGVSLRLSGWSPHYFAITQKGTDADLLAHGTIESSRNPNVQGILDRLKKSDSE